MNNSAFYRILRFTSAASISYLIYWYFLGSRHKKQRKELQTKLEQTEKMLKDLESRLMTIESDIDVQQTSVRTSSNPSEKKKEIRIWMDGVFDMMHYGHMNAFRQGRALGTCLIVGVNCDETINACKGKPICSEQERIDTVKGCKWADQVVTGVPYIMNEEYIQYIIDTLRIDYVVHGDDPCIVDGKNVYETAIKLGKYLTIPRTEGISTTDIVGRMLLLTSAHHLSLNNNNKEGESKNTGDEPLERRGRSNSILTSDTIAVAKQSHFLTTSKILRLFGAYRPRRRVHHNQNNKRTVVYVSGAWDMFHAGHLEFLRAVRRHVALSQDYYYTAKADTAQGDAEEEDESMLDDDRIYLIAGVHSDSLVNRRCGMNLPIMNLQERVLSLLGCKWVDDVLIDAPASINQEMISSLHIDLVVTNNNTNNNANNSTNSNMNRSYSNSQLNEMGTGNAAEDNFSLPRSLGILSVVTTGQYNLSTWDFVARIQQQQMRFADRFEKKMAIEKQFYRQKYNL